MDVFKAWPGRAESIVISQESYMRCTGGVAPWRRDGDKGPSYYAVCPLCDNPIQRRWRGNGSPASIWGRGPPVTCFATRRSGYAACWAAMTGNRPSMT